MIHCLSISQYVARAPVPLVNVEKMNRTPFVGTLTQFLVILVMTHGHDSWSLMLIPDD